MPHNIIFFTQSIIYGGDDTVLIQLLKAWPRKDSLTLALNSSHPGREIYISSLKGRAEIIALNEETVEEEKEGVSSFFHFLRPWRFLRCVHRLSRLLADRRPDAVVLSSGGFPLTTLSWRFLCAARLIRPPLIILVIHNYPNPRPDLLRKLYFYFFNRLSLLLCDKIIAVSRDCANSLNHYNSRKTRPIITIYNGLAPRVEKKDIAEKNRSLGIISKRVIGAIGNLEERKGFKYLIMAMKRIAATIPDATLIIIGAPSEFHTHDQLRHLIQELGLSERIRLPGFLPDAGQYAECFDVCVIPSISHESFGLLSLEAMQYEKPVVATRVGGLPEIVMDGRTGYLVPPRDSDAIAETVIALLQTPHEARVLGENGHQLWLKHFTASRMAQDYCAMIT